MSSPTFSARSRRRGRVALELTVGESSFLERPERLHPLVRLPEEAESEHGDHDDQQRGPHESDEQLGVDAGRQAADRPDERIASRSSAVAACSGSAPLWRSVSSVTAQGFSSVVPPTILVISQRPSTRATSMSAAVTAATFLVFTST